MKLSDEEKIVLDMAVEGDFALYDAITWLRSDLPFSRGPQLSDSYLRHCAREAIIRLLEKNLVQLAKRQGVSGELFPLSGDLIGELSKDEYWNGDLPPDETEVVVLATPLGEKLYNSGNIL